MKQRSMLFKYRSGAGHGDFSKPLRPSPGSNEDEHVFSLAKSHARWHFSRYLREGYQARA